MSDRLDPARSFAVDFDAAKDAFRLCELPLAEAGDAAFLDRRLAAVAQDAGEHAALAEADTLPDHAPALLLHTAFCCSTLLARALHAPPGVVALKEPYALAAVAMAALDRDPGDEWSTTRLRAALRWLGRPWSPGGRVLVKPTNLLNRLMLPLLAASPDSRVVLLHGSLREFLVSCIKKLPAAEQRIDAMARSIFPGLPLARALGLERGTPLNFVEACVMTWYAQVERYADALARDDGDRLRTLDMDVLLHRPAETVRACAEWLRLPGTMAGLDDRVGREFSRHAKSTDQAFDPAQREREKAMVLARYGDTIDRAEAWARQTVEPALPRVPRFKPLALAPSP